METNEQQVSRNIKGLMKRYGEDNTSISTKLKVTDKTITNIINNPFKYSMEKLQTLANAIGCNIDEFFLPLSFTKGERNKNTMDIIGNDKKWHIRIKLENWKICYWILMK